MEGRETRAGSGRRPGRPPPARLLRSARERRQRERARERLIDEENDSFFVNSLFKGKGSSVNSRNRK
jgi:hypothetical protein